MVNKSFYDQFPDEEEITPEGKLDKLRKMVGVKEKKPPFKKGKVEQEDITVVQSAVGTSEETAKQLVEFLEELSNRMGKLEDSFAGRDAKISQMNNKYENFKNLSVGLDLTNLERVTHLLENTEQICNERMSKIREILEGKRIFLKKASYVGYAEILEQTLKECALMFDRILSHKSSERNELDMYIRKTQDKFNLFEQ